MKTEFTHPAGDTIVETVIRPAMGNDLRADTVNVLKPASRPHILTRRNARWARRAAHA